VIVSVYVAVAPAPTVRDGVVAMIVKSLGGGPVAYEAYSLQVSAVNVPPEKVLGKVPKDSAR
jgi:hypothetical protein